VRYGRHAFQYSRRTPRCGADEEIHRQGATQERNGAHQFAAEAFGGSDDQVADASAGWTDGHADRRVTCGCTGGGPGRSARHGSAVHSTSDNRNHRRAAKAGGAFGSGQETADDLHRRQSFGDCGAGGSYRGNWDDDLPCVFVQGCHWSLRNLGFVMASPNIVVLTQENFKDEVLQSTTPVLVDFWAEWCGPCKMISPILGELADEYEGRVKIAKVNIDEQQGLASEYGIRAIPTLLLFDKGQVADQIVGLRSKRDLKASFDRVAV
jgi:thioredoxin 1